VPLALTTLGTNGYGQVVAVTAFTSLLSWMSLGLPSAVQTIGPQLGSPGRVWQLIRKILPLYTVYVLVGMLAYVALEARVNPQVASLVLPAESPSESAELIFWAVLYMSVYTYFLVYQLAFVALHRVYIYNLYSSLYALAPLGSLALVRSFNGASADYFRFLALLALAIGAASAVHYWLRYRGSQDPADDLTAYHLSCRNIAATAGAATLVNIISLVINQLDYVVLGHYAETAALVHYSIVSKLTALETALLGVVFSSVAPLFGGWYAERDWPRINHLYGLLLSGMSVLGGGIVLFNIVFLELVISIWVGEGKFAGRAVVLPLSAYVYLFGLYTTSYIVASSFNVKRRVSVAIAPIEPAAKILLTVWLTQRFGPVGTAWSVFLVALFLTSWMTPTVLHHFSDGLVRFQHQFVLRHAAIALLPMAAVSVYAGAIPAAAFRVAVGGLVLVLYLVLSFRLMGPSDRAAVVSLGRALARRVCPLPN